MMQGGAAGCRLALPHEPQQKGRETMQTENRQKETTSAQAPQAPSSPTNEQLAALAKGGDRQAMAALWGKIRACYTSCAAGICPALQGGQLLLALPGRTYSRKGILSSAKRCACV